MSTFYRETDFKETPIGKVPKDWKVARLGEVIEVYDSERIPLSEMERSKRKGFYPYCGATGIIDWIDGYIFDGEFILLIEDGGPFGKFENKAYMMSGKFWVNNHAHVLKVINGRGENVFLLHLLNFFDLNPHIVGSTRKKLNQEHMKRVAIPLPDLSEQQKIAETLSIADEAIQKTGEIIAKTEHLKKGLMQELLTKGIGHKEFKDTEIGGIPKEWEVIRLGRAVTCKKGTKPKTLRNQKEQDTLPYLTADAIRSGAFTQWVKVTDECVKVGKDDIILIWDGFYCGDAFIGLDGVLSSTMIVVKPNARVDKHLLYYLLKTHFRELNTKISGMYLKHVSKSVFEGLRLPLPPLLEQQKIAEVLSLVDQKLELERNEKAKLERIKQGMMDLLLTGRIRIKVS